MLPGTMQHAAWFQALAPVQSEPRSKAKDSVRLQWAVPAFVTSKSDMKSRIETVCPSMQRRIFSGEGVGDVLCARRCARLFWLVGWLFVRGSVRRMHQDERLRRMSIHFVKRTQKLSSKARFQQHGPDLVPAAKSAAETRGPSSLTPERCASRICAGLQSSCPRLLQEACRITAFKIPASP